MAGFGTWHPTPGSARNFTNMPCSGDTEQLCGLLGQGYAWAEDKEHCEEYGRMLGADPTKVSLRAKKRGLPQARLCPTQQFFSQTAA